MYTKIQRDKVQGNGKGMFSSSLPLKYPVIFLEPLFVIQELRKNREMPFSKTTAEESQLTVNKTSKKILEKQTKIIFSRYF